MLVVREHRVYRLRWRRDIDHCLYPVVVALPRYIQGAELRGTGPGHEAGEKQAEDECTRHSAPTQRTYRGIILSGMGLFAALPGRRLRLADTGEVRLNLEVPQCPGHMQREAGAPEPGITGAARRRARDTALEVVVQRQVREIQLAGTGERQRRQGGADPAVGHHAAG